MQPIDNTDLRFGLGLFSLLVIYVIWAISKTAENQNQISRYWHVLRSLVDPNDGIPSLTGSKQKMAIFKLGYYLSLMTKEPSFVDLERMVAHGEWEKMFDRIKLDGDVYWI